MGTFSYAAGYNAGMKYSLRSLMIVVAVGPFLLWSAYVVATIYYREIVRHRPHTPKEDYRAILARKEAAERQKAHP